MECPSYLNLFGVSCTCRGKEHIPERISKLSSLSPPIAVNPLAEVVPTVLPHW